MSSFRTFKWDPALLVLQMVSLQSLFYASQTLVMVVFSTLTSYEATLAHVFSTQPSRSVVLIQLCGSVCLAGLVGVVVGRTRQCLDFVCSLHLFHLIAVIFVAKFPTSFSWWALQVGSITLATVLGEYVCMKIESQEIFISSDPSKYEI